MNKSENTPLIQTERLILRKFTENDLDDFFLIMSDIETNRFLPWHCIKNLEEAKLFLQKNYIEHYKKTSAYHYAICLQENNKAIGYVNFGNEKSHDFGYGLRKEFWHKGIATEASQAIINKLKKNGYKFITSTHDINNPRSGAIMEKLGMSYCYSYIEQWQPKDISVTFRMYQLNFDKNDESVYMEYYNKYPEHFIENI